MIWKIPFSFQSKYLGFFLQSSYSTQAMLIDTHCHLASRQFASDSRHDLIQRAAGSGITHMVTLGSCQKDWEGSVSWAKEFPDAISACLGLHPMDVMETTPNWKQELESLLADITPAAIGETGLDYFYPAPKDSDEATYKALQHESLEYHFELAAQLGINIVLHTRDREGDASFHDALAIARRYAGRVRPVFHCFIGTTDHARRIFDELDGLISFTGVVTFKNAGHLPDVAAWCPATRFMLETDSPYLSPVPLRGKRNEPAHLSKTAEFIAWIRHISLQQLAETTTNTAREFFDITGLKKKS